ncbi:uncharacterized protein V5649_009012 [Rhynchonycteris naso]
MKGFFFLLFTISLLVMTQVRAAPQRPWHCHPVLPRPAWHGRKGMQLPEHSGFSHGNRGSPWLGSTFRVPEALRHPRGAVEYYGMADTTMSMTPGHMNTVNTTTPSNVPTKSIPGRTTSKTMGKTTSNTISRTTSRTTTSMTTKKFKSAAPALSSLGMGSVLLFLTNTLLQQFHLH